MKTVPKYVLRKAWIAGIRAQRDKIMEIERAKNRAYKHPAHWHDPEELPFDGSEWEAGMDAAARVLLGLADGVRK